MFGFGMFHEPLRPFSRTYRCFSVSMLPGQERQDVDNGGKIILPPSALEYLTRLNVVYPMLFKLTHGRLERQTHCGVLEFVADEGRCYLPYWMMRNLMIDEGDVLTVESATLPVASYSKFEPQSPDFLDITNPKAMLENALRSFACLTSGDVIAIRYNNKLYELRVLETRPGPAVSIIECDMDVEFAPPVGYQEPERPQQTKKAEQDDVEEMLFETTDFVAFRGGGNRLDGKSSGSPTSSGVFVPHKRGVPDFEFKMGRIQFLRNVRFNNNSAEADRNNKTFKPFEGSGTTLRSKDST
ncbi:ubiquitin recognition factor in ER-associated degradation protein 1 [Folsomia candida]|uniref:Ubiquitin fusion degradation protein 1 homolog n=1 Tax=Folsomia candida TaxID=158441 RepID=A0A226E5J1_FOLCA|nr:ubiquitin recognition factor in ER-associated degradation protein 1 [Folsomia candida]OXA52570.1 Ubiquitin fusion degradation protein 1 [Folsomia candida]QBH74167.1 ubiquitin fusion degradaton protein [Folsomia candida]